MDEITMVCKISEKSVKCTDGKVVFNMGSFKGKSFTRVIDEKGVKLGGKFKNTKDPIKTMTAQQIIDMV
jgi:hypothetical protein